MTDRPEHMQAQRPPANALYAYVGAFLDELRRSGVRHAVVCPGSRSTPLALALAEQPGIRVWMHIDERSAAFFGLGLAKRLRAPVALVCTSGTAAANFLPAVVEAYTSHVPLIVLTADRPPELRGVGAPQTIDQQHLYGTHVRWFAEAALPEATNAALRYVRTLADRAVAEAVRGVGGPVHVNLPFREPLVPDPQPLPPSSARDRDAWEGRAADAPFTSVADAQPTALAPARIAALAALLRASPRGVIVVGPHNHADLAGPLLALARRLGYPLLADPLAHVRGLEDSEDGTHIIASYDAFLRVPRVSSAAEPQVVLRFGAMPTSKPTLLYLSRFVGCPHIVVDATGEWPDPAQLATELIHADPAALCASLLAALPADEPVGERTGAGSGTWLDWWRQVDDVTRGALTAGIERFGEPFEGRVFGELARLLPEGAVLFAGNSMPVRDLDTFYWGASTAREVFGNRGASGIDGVVSTALGVSAACKPDEPVVLVIGDLSFFHDLNGLLASRLHGLALTVVLVNNDGGGIFSFLPQAQYPEHFEQFFGTPTGLDFAPVVRMYGGEFCRVDGWAQFREAVAHGLSAGGLHVVEVVTDRARNVAQHQTLWSDVERALTQGGLIAHEEATR